MGSFSVWHWLVFLFLFLLPQVFYILALQASLKAVDPALRAMSPGLAWLLLIPLFNYIWIFVVVIRLARGYQRMWENQRLSSETNGGYGVGIAFAVSWVLCLIPLINLLAWIPALVFWVLHWVRVSQAKKLVLNTVV
jgi:hypothetical protein